MSGSLTARGGLLARLPEQVRDRLLPEGHRIDVPRGGVVYRSGDPPRCVLVSSGLVRVFLTSPQGRQVTVRHARPGELLGVAAAVAGPSQVGVQALLDSSLLFFSAAALSREAHRDAQVAWAVAEEVAERLYEAMSQIAANAFGSVRERLARELLDSAVPGKQGQLVVHATKQQLAEAVGSAREVVARTLRSFREERLVRNRPAGPEELLAHHPTAVVLVVLAQIVASLLAVGWLAREPRPAAASRVAVV